MQNKDNASMRLQDDTLYIEGNINFETVVILLKEGIEHISQHETLSIDFEKASVNSAALSLLLRWQHAAKLKQHSVHFVNISDAFRKLINLVGIAAFCSIIEENNG